MDCDVYLDWSPFILHVYITLTNACTYFNGDKDDVDEESNQSRGAQNEPGIENTNDKEHRGGEHEAAEHDGLVKSVSNAGQNIKNLDFFLNEKGETESSDFTCFI